MLSTVDGMGTMDEVSDAIEGVLARAAESREVRTVGRLTKTGQIAIYRPQFWICRLAVPVAGVGYRGRVLRLPVSPGET